MRSRTLVASLLLAVGLLAVAQPLWAARQSPARPNVLIVHVDQLRFDCLGACGNRDVKTPNLDRLAADGVRYVNSFCEFPVCTPSRYSLISGRPTFEHRGWDNRCTLAPTINTFPKIFAPPATGPRRSARCTTRPPISTLAGTRWCWLSRTVPGDGMMIIIVISCVGVWSTGTIS